MLLHSLVLRIIALECYHATDVDEELRALLVKVRTLEHSLLKCCLPCVVFFGFFVVFSSTPLDVH
jgi:hypothetical protein